MRVGTLPTLVAALAFAFVAGSPQLPGGRAEAASFSCAQAASKTEIAICGDAGLSSLDGAIGGAYQQRLALDPGLRQIQRGWLKARDLGCGRDRGCLRAFMISELAMLRSGSRPGGRIPTQVGSCSLTVAKLVGSRLEGDPGSGSAIGEVNGAVQISYDEVPQIDASRRGDPVLVCLVSLPTDCPPGDDRGKTYAATNLRTLGAWDAPDSEHGCGGA